MVKVKLDNSIDLNREGAQIVTLAIGQIILQMFISKGDCGRLL